MRRLLLLLPVLLLGFASAIALASDGAAQTSAAGTIKALRASSITVVGHGRTLSCALGPSAVDPLGFTTGDQVTITCQGGALVGIGDVARPPTAVASTPAAGGTTISFALTAPLTPKTGAHVIDAAGAIKALTTSFGKKSIAVGGFSCKVGPYSPRTSGLAIGDVVRIACVNDTLYQLRVLARAKAAASSPAPGVLVTATQAPGTSSQATTTATTTATAGGGTTTAPTTTTYSEGQQSVVGSLTALSATSATAAGLTCSIGSSTPSTSGLAVGSWVLLDCNNAVITTLSATPASTQTITTGTTTVNSQTYNNDVEAAGPITSLTATSITVANLTCPIASSSPSTSAFAVGSDVSIDCSRGSLFLLDPDQQTSNGTTCPSGSYWLANTFTMSSMCTLVDPQAPTAAQQQIVEQAVSSQASASGWQSSCSVETASVLGALKPAGPAELVNGSVYSCALYTSGPNLDSSIQVNGKTEKIDLQGSYEVMQSGCSLSVQSGSTQPAVLNDCVANSATVLAEQLSSDASFK